MAALFARGRAKLSLVRWLAAILLSVAIVPPAAAQPLAPEDTIVVVLDQARLLQLPERASNVVVGNPLIADVSIQPGGLIVLTGKGNGVTNLIVTDKKGVVLLEKNVEVTGSNDRTVVVYRGAERETYSCTPDCSRRLTLGDMPEYFDKTMAEIVVRNNQATAAGALNSGR